MLLNDLQCVLDRIGIWGPCCYDLWKSNVWRSWKKKERKEKTREETRHKKWIWVNVRDSTSITHDFQSRNMLHMIAVYQKRDVSLPWKQAVGLNQEQLIHWSPTIPSAAVIRLWDLSTLICEFSQAKHSRLINVWSFTAGWLWHSWAPRKNAQQSVRGMPPHDRKEADQHHSLLDWHRRRINKSVTYIQMAGQGFIVPLTSCSGLFWLNGINRRLLILCGLRL